MTRARVLGIGAAILAVLSCDAPFKPPPERPVPPSPPPSASQLTLQLASTHPDDGAMVVEIRGLWAREPSNRVASNWMLAEGVDSMTVRIVVVGDIADGPLLGFGISEGATASSYSAVVVAAADRQGIPRPSLDGYTLTITP